MKDPKRAEIKRVLMGRVVMAEDGKLVPIPKGEFLESPVGIGDGALGTFVFGVGSCTREYAGQMKRNHILSAARKAMENVGRGLTLREQPEGVACLRRFVLTRPVVLVFTMEEGIPTLTAWTGRGVTGWISRRRAIRIFERSLPEGISPVRKKPEKGEKSAKKGKRAKEAKTPEEKGEAPKSRPIQEEKSQ